MAHSLSVRMCNGPAGCTCMACSTAVRAYTDSAALRFATHHHRGNARWHALDAAPSLLRAHEAAQAAAEAREEALRKGLDHARNQRAWRNRFVADAFAAAREDAAAGADDDGDKLGSLLEVIDSFHKNRRHVLCVLCCSCDPPFFSSSFVFPPVFLSFRVFT